MEKPSESGVTFSFEDPSDGSGGGSDEERPEEVEADDAAELEAVTRNADPEEVEVDEEDSQSSEDDDEVGFWRVRGSFIFLLCFCFGVIEFWVLVVLLIFFDVV